MIYQSKAYKYWETDMTSAIDCFFNSQNEDGSYYENVGLDNVPDRMSAESDLEYIMVLAPYRQRIDKTLSIGPNQLSGPVLWSNCREAATPAGRSPSRRLGTSRAYRQERAEGTVAPIGRVGFSCPVFYMTFNYMELRT